MKKLYLATAIPGIAGLMGLLLSLQFKKVLLADDAKPETALVKQVQFGTVTDVDIYAEAEWPDEGTVNTKPVITISILRVGNSAIWKGAKVVSLKFADGQHNYAPIYRTHPVTKVPGSFVESLVFDVQLAQFSKVVAGNNLMIICPNYKCEVPEVQLVSLKALAESTAIINTPR